SIITILLIRKRTKPISILNDYASNIAEGNLNIKDISIKNNDEIGELAKTLNYMAEHLRSIIQQFKTNAEHVAASSGELTGNVNQANLATEQIAATMQQIATGVGQQTDNIEDTNQIAKDMSSGVQQIASNAEHASTTSIDASKKESEGTEAINNTEEQTNASTNHINHLANVVEGLEERSNEIDKITNGSTATAHQTNLLALSPAIAAARGGEN